MRHYVFTRSAYGPEWAPPKNAHRLSITRGITAPMMARQTVDWTWVVLLDPGDPMRSERMEVFRSAGAPVVFMDFARPEVLHPAPWDIRARRAHRLEQVAATAYWAPWRAQTGEPDDVILMTRLDDDDALCANTLDRVQRAARTRRRRAIFMHPMGYRVWKHRCSLVRHPSNAMQTLLTPPGDTASVYDYGHTVAKRFAPVVVVDELPAWLWSRHRSTISGHKRADHAFNREIRRLFPVDWSVLNVV